MNEQPNRGGRPRKATSPNAVIRDGMLDAARIARRARRILETKLRQLETSSNPPVDEIISILQALDRSVEGAGKLLVKGVRDDQPEAATSAEDIMNEIQKGTKK